MRLRRLPAALLAAVTTVALVAVAPAGASAAPAPGAAAAPGPVSVTLITGDRVTVGANGGLSVQTGPGRDGVRFVGRTRNGHRYVIPVDALPLLRDNRLDQRLFDLTALRDFGYTGDAELPLLIAYPEGRTRSARSAAGGTARVVRDLPGVNALAVRAARAARAELWTSLTGGTPSARSLTPGVDRVYLDGKRKVSLDVSVPQIGAPAAWRAGLDGTGVKVAVLDSGIDATHPDFAGRIAAAENFSAARTADDEVGHGTHVASIIAGSGARSGGRYRGVAPGAQLVIGKVCESLWCEESAILAGMEWAAPLAPVVNLSLGGGDLPGIDPLEQAVEDLTAAYGSLFVIAAGNAGGTATVGSPGSADSALTVGAVDDEDQLADFSSRGPRVGDDAIKPDITAPGVDIVAAKAANGVIGDPAADGYVSLSGTSMATPHVAGAAAILTQQHPGWSPRQRKTVLMGAAQPTDGVDVFGQGAGRVDVARAIRQTVSVDEGSVSFGRQLWPHADDVPVTKTVTYRNAGAAPVTLSLALDTESAAFSVAATALTVPAGGTATTTITADTRVGEPDGFRTGRLVATGPGDLRVETPFAVNQEVESYDVKLRHVGRDGAPAADYLTVFTNLADGTTYEVSGPGPDPTVRLPKGEYGMFSWIYGADDFTMLVTPKRVVASATTIRLDARQGEPMLITVPRKDARPTLIAANADWIGEEFGIGATALSEEYGDTFLAQVGPRTKVDGFFGSINAAFAKLDGGSAQDSPFTYDLGYLRKGSFYTGFTRHVRPADLATIKARYAQEATGVEGVKSNFAVLDENLGGWSVLLPFRLPFERTEWVNTDGPVRWAPEFYQQLPPEGEEFPEWISWLFGPAQRFHGGATYRQEWNRAVFAPSVAGDVDTAVRAGDLIAVGLPLFSDGAGHLGGSLTEAARTALYAGDTLIGEEASDYAEFEVPAAEQAYRLEVSASRGAPFRLSTTVSGTWTFRSGHGTGRLPLSTVRFSPKLDERNAAPAGRAYDIPITVERPAGAGAGRNRTLTAEVSYDDGRTWRAAAVRGTGDQRIARVTHPAGAGFASLRVHATDTRGNTAGITVIRAYGIA